MEGKVLNRHTDVVQGSPSTSFLHLLMATFVYGVKLLISPVLTGVKRDFPASAWHPQGQQIAAGDTTVNY